MTGRSMHCTSEQLQMLLDGRLAGGEREVVLTHLQECARCMAASRGLEQLDRGLRQLPVSAAGVEFTEKVMEAITPSGRLSFAFRLVENLAYVFALLIVTGIIAVVFVATGVIDSGQVSDGQGLVNTYVGATSDWLAGALHGGTAWLERYLPTRGGANIMLFGIGVLAGLALLDRLLHRRFVQRAR
jgi:anti-sigma factor RsiW